MYDNNVMQLRNKNMKINVWFYSRFKHHSITPLFVTGNRQFCSKVSTKSENMYYDDLLAYFFSTVEISWWNLSLYSSVTAPMFGGKTSKWECKKWMFNDIYYTPQSDRRLTSPQQFPCRFRCLSFQGNLDKLLWTSVMQISHFPSTGFQIAHY